MKLPHVLSLGFPTLGLVTMAFLLSGPRLQVVPANAPGRSPRPDLTHEQRKILGYMSLVRMDDGKGGACEAIRITGVNLQLVNGMGSTNTSNCAGNLIVGYNELRGAADDRTGSHNVVIGGEHNYTSFGGLVAGLGNSIEGDFASVSGGRSNTASGSHATVSGGRLNAAAGTCSAISGGVFNAAIAHGSSISGGATNLASGYYSSINGGGRGMATGNHSTVSGGWANSASGGRSSISGGIKGRALGYYASVSGGLSRSVYGIWDWQAGSLFEDR